MPSTTTSFGAMRALTRASRPGSRFIPLSARLPQRIPRIQPLSSIRFHSSEIPPISSTPPTSSQLPSTPTKASSLPPHAPRKDYRPPPPQALPSKPEYEMTFTCKPCSTRSTHRVSKQGYHYGSVLITCPECRNRHVISDHLNIFGDKHLTIEDLMREQGQLVKRGTLSEDGDLEFWADGRVTKRGEGAEEVHEGKSAEEGEEGEGKTGD